MELSKDLSVVNEENLTLRTENKSFLIEMSKCKEQTQIQSMHLSQLNDKIHVN